MSESVQTSVSSRDVAMGNAVSPAPASSSGQSGPGEAPAQERLKRVDTDEERCKMSRPSTSLSIAGRSLQELCKQTLSDVAHWSFHSGLGGSGRMDVSGELLEHEQWEPEKIHYDHYSGEPLDEVLYQKGRDDELRAMQGYGVYVEIPIREAVDSPLLTWRETG